LRQRTSVQDYTQRFYAITLDIPNITEDECVDKYVRGLKPRVAREVELRGLTVLDEIVTAAQRFDSIDYRMSAHPVSSHVEKRYFNNQENGPTPMELGTMQVASRFKAQKSDGTPFPKKLTDEDKANMRKEGRCYYCRKVGHVALACPNKGKPKNEKTG
jgi:hypothetical protein